jgi:hypothetical protein
MRYLPPFALLILLLAEVSVAQSTTQPSNVTPWAEPVNGITIRIEQMELNFQPHWYKPHIYVRVKNVSDHVLTIPLPPAWGESEYSVSLKISGKWEPVKLDEPDNRGAAAPPGACQLKPNEDVLCDVRPIGRTRFRFAEAASVGLSVKVPKQPDGWTGTITTDPLPAFVPQEVIDRSRHTLSMPGYIPPVSAEVLLENGPAGEPAFAGLHRSNWEFFNQLELYPHEAVASELDHRRSAASDPQMKMLLAAEAAAHGSESARRELTNSGPPIDAQSVRARALAFARVLRLDPAPDWAVDAAAQMMKDERSATDRYSVADLATQDLDLPLSFVRAKSPRAVSLLLDIVASANNRDELAEAINVSDDPRIEPFIIQHLRDELA